MEFIDSSQDPHNVAIKLGHQTQKCNRCAQPALTCKPVFAAGRRSTGAACPEVCALPCQPGGLCSEVGRGTATLCGQD